MTTYRNALPQLDDGIFLTDGGLETTLIFHEGYELPCFAAFDLLKDEQGIDVLKNYYRSYADIAVKAQSGFILESPTWRASQVWGDQLGYNRKRLRDINSQSISLMEEIRGEYSNRIKKIVISASIGPRGDGYLANDQMTVAQASEYHREQIATFAKTKADLVSAITLTYPEEAIGVALAAQEHGLPSVIGFTTEVDGRLPNGQRLKEAIEQVDSATGDAPAYYMVNCAHPDHFSAILKDDEQWTQRIRGIRANASRCSHAELDEAQELDDGNPAEFGRLCRELHTRLRNLSVLGGCCGTDQRHIQAIASAF